MSTLVGYRYPQYHVKFKFSGSRSVIRQKSALKALELLKTLI